MEIKLLDVIMRLAIILVIAAAFFGGCSYINSKFGVEDDNFIEEMLEKYIDGEIGFDLDLTPYSVEK